MVITRHAPSAKKMASIFLGTWIRYSWLIFDWSFQHLPASRWRDMP